MIYSICGSESGQQRWDRYARQFWAKKGAHYTLDLEFCGGTLTITNTEVWFTLANTPRQLCAVKIQSMFCLFNKLFSKYNPDIVKAIKFFMSYVFIIDYLPIPTLITPSAGFKLWLDHMETCEDMPLQHISESMWDLLGAIYWCNRKSDNKRLVNITDYTDQIYVLAHIFEIGWKPGRSKYTHWLSFAQEHLIPAKYIAGAETLAVFL